jgi:thioredoxin reductase
MEMELQDCIIVGGGPAGMNAAIVLGRSRRKVLVFDSRSYRNRYSHGVHNYLTRDGVLPGDFIEMCRKELKHYGIRAIHKTVVNARKNEDNLFVVKDEDGTIYHSRKLLIATGLTDNLPSVPGFEEMYGISVFHCPYCDGWEVRDKKLGVYARDKNGSELALQLKCWSDDVTLYTDGRFKIRPNELEELEANNVTIIKDPIEKLEGTNGHIRKVVFRNGEERACQAMFFVNGYKQQCDIAETFGCEMTKKGVVATNRYQQTNIDGLYVAGDASKDMHFVVVAAAEGAKAGVIINKELQKRVIDKITSIEKAAASKIG